MNPSRKHDDEFESPVKHPEKRVASVAALEAECRSLKTDLTNAGVPDALLKRVERVIEGLGALEAK